MADFNYDALREKLANRLGYHLFLDYGTVEDYRDMPYREMNEIVTPVVGLFRLNPTPLTALKYPYIAITTATIDIPAPTEEAENVRDALNDLAASLNATSEKLVQGDTSYTVVYGFETAVIGDKRRDVSLYNGEIIPITQVVTFTIVEAGVSSFDVGLRIDGLDVPLLMFMETRTAASETTPNANAKGEVTVTQELYGITFETPAVENTLGDLLREMVDEGNGNRAHAVEVTKSGVTKVYMMAVGTAGSTVRPPNNVGFSFSLAEISPNAATFGDNWTKTRVKGSVVYKGSANSVVFWGDGTSSIGATVHTYLDGKTEHTARVFSKANKERWGAIAKGTALYGKRIRCKNGSIIQSSSLPALILNTDEGDKLEVVNGRLTMTIADNSYTMDISDTIMFAVVPAEFTTILRGKVQTINTDQFVYDRWAANEEV